MITELFKAKDSTHFMDLPLQDLEQAKPTNSQIGPGCLVVTKWSKTCLKSRVQLLRFKLDYGPVCLYVYMYPQFNPDQLPKTKELMNKGRVKFWVKLK